MRMDSEDLSIFRKKYEPVRSVAIKLGLSILTLTVKGMLYKPIFCKNSRETVGS